MQSMKQIIIRTVKLKARTGPTKTDAKSRNRNCHDGAPAALNCQSQTQNQFCRNAHGKFHGRHLNDFRAIQRSVPLQAIGTDHARQHQSSWSKIAGGEFVWNCQCSQHSLTA
jgi:hypothetical protein